MVYPDDFMPELKNKYSIPPKLYNKPRDRKSDTLFSFVFSRDLKDWMPKMIEKRERSRKYREYKFSK